MRKITKRRKKSRETNNSKREKKQKKIARTNTKSNTMKMSKGF